LIARRFTDDAYSDHLAAGGKFWRRRPSTWAAGPGERAAPCVRSANDHGEAGAANVVIIYLTGRYQPPVTPSKP
jgi:hypothetical protein